VLIDTDILPQKAMCSGSGDLF